MLEFPEGYETGPGAFTLKFIHSLATIPLLLSLPFLLVALYYQPLIVGILILVLVTLRIWKMREENEEAQILQKMHHEYNTTTMEELLKKVVEKKNKS